MKNVRRGVTLLSLCMALATAAFAAVVDGSIQIPINYYTFLPPAVGGSYTDADFGTSIKRITNALATPNVADGGNLTFITSEYSTMSPFNNDNSRLLLAHQSYFALYDGSGSFLKNLPLEVHASSEPRWSRSDANAFYYVHGNQLKQYNVATDGMSVVHTFSEYSSITGKGESDICFDGNHFVFAGDNRYVFVYEISTDRKGPVYDTGGRGFDSLYITPNDNVSITWLATGTSRYSGVELFDRNMNFLRQLTHSGGHMDYTRDSNGDEVLIWTNANDATPICNNGITKVRLSDGQQTCLLSLDWSLAVHISAPDNNGWAYVETYAPSDPDPLSSGWKPYTNELLKVKLDGSQTMRLAHHRSRPFNSYNWTPRLSVSRDGSRLIYNSNYGLQGILGYPTEYSDVYLISDSSSSGGSGGGGGGSSGSARFEQNDAAVAYSGTWFSNNLSGQSGGSAALSMDAGSRATFTFSGTSVDWIAYRDEWSGTANVYVDGVYKTTVDTYASPAQFQAKGYSISGLAQAQHTLVIEVTGNHSASSAGSWVWVDAFDVGSSTPPQPPQPPPAPSPVRIEENNSAIAYSGTWYPNTQPADSGGSAVLAMDKNARANLTFKGTAVSWIGYRDQWSGIARVYIDGSLVATVDTYATSPKAQTAIYTKSGLAAGTHTITVEVAGRKNRSSGGSWIWIDAFDVTP